MDTSIHSPQSISSAKRFFEWFSDDYERIYDINLDTGEYLMTYFNDSNHSAPTSGNYITAFPVITRSHVDIQFQDEFLKTFCYDNIKKVFENDINAHLSMRYVGNSDVGRNSWKQVSSRSYIANDVLHAVFMIKDISVEKEYENLSTQNALLKSEIEYTKKINEQHERFEIIVRQTDSDVIEWNREHGYVFVSTRLSDNYYLSYDKNGIFNNVVHPEDAKAYNDTLKSLFKGIPYTELLCRVMKKDGKYIWVRIAMSNFYDSNGRLIRTVASVLDVDTQIKAYQDLNFRANYDKLTGIENRDYFYTSSAEYMAKYPDSNYAVINFDIDKFRIINDVYGSKIGDNILCHIANFLKAEVKHGRCCRMYSDNFAVLLRYKNTEDIISFLDKLTKHMENFSLDIKLILSYGIYVAEDKSISIHTMYSRAGYAKKTIKGNVIVHYAFYDKQIRSNMLEDKEIENEMETALTDNQFRLYLQPKVDIVTSKVIGAEALVRWIHPSKGLIPPTRFIPLFERNSFIIKMDIYIWEQVCRLLRKWIDEKKTPMPISVNVSRLHIIDPTLKNTLLQLTEKYKIPHELLELEITESAFFDNIDTLQNCINELRSLGFTVSIDDFGSGYSSLNMLREIPVDILKIDREFLKEIVTTTKGKIVISHIIAMANEMELKVVTEGVETIEQADFLLKTGCRIAQGFLYSKPLSVQNYELYAFTTKSHITPPSHSLFKKQQIK